MFAISTRSIVPAAVPSESAAPGSSVWTCTLSADSSPTTSSESPSRSSSRLEPLAVEPVALDEEDGAVAVARQLLVDRLDGEPLRSPPAAAPARTRRPPPRRRRGRARAGPRRPRRRRPPRAAPSSCSGVRATASSPRRTRSTSSSPRRGVAGRALLRLLGELADHREHRPLDGPPHGAVGGVGGAAQRLRRERRRDPVRRLREHVGRAADDLREDHARVAARAHQRAAGDVAGERGAVGRAATPRPPGRPRARSSSGSCRCRRPGPGRR